MTGRRPPTIPDRWANLFDDGEVDGFLLSPLGDLGDLRIAALRGDYGTDADPADLVILVHQGGAQTTLVMASPVEPVWGAPLSQSNLAVVGDFIESHRQALIDHWVGATCSVELWEQVLRTQ